MSDTSPNLICFFESDAVKRANAGTGDFESASSTRKQSLQP